MKRKLIIPTVILCILFALSCKDPYMDKKFAAYDNLPVGLWLAERPEYSMWIEMLKKAELLDAVNIGTKFTCFVADNDAVREYLADNNLSSVEEMEASRVTLLMRYHIIAGIGYKSKDFIGQLDNKTLSGDYLSVNGESGGYNNMYVNQQSKIITPDIEPLNGTIHVLDKVLRPVVETNWDFISTDPRYSIFSAAAERCGLDSLLDRYERQLGIMKVRDYKTVFVVSDSVFNLYNIHSVDELADILKVKYNQSDAQKVLYDYIAYHIIPENADFRNLGTFSAYIEDNQRVRNLNTYDTTGGLISIADIASELILNRTGEEQGVRLVPGRYDKLASNGYLHEIDGPLFITLAEQAVVSWELTDYDAFRALELYRKHSSQVDGNKYVIDREAAAAEGLVWHTVPDDMEAVRYYLRSGQWFDYNDAVTMSLGYVGWAEFRTPVMARGKYKVKIKYLGYSARGKARFYFDGLPFVEHSFTANYNKDLGEIEFSEQSSHVFKVVVVSKGDMEIDQLIFTPVK